MKQNIETGFQSLKQKEIGTKSKKNRLIEEWVMGDYAHSIYHKLAIYVYFALLFTYKINSLPDCYQKQIDESIICERIVIASRSPPAAQASLLFRANVQFSRNSTID